MSLLLLRLCFLCLDFLCRLPSDEDEDELDTDRERERDRLRSRRFPRCRSLLEERDLECDLLRRPGERDLDLRSEADLRLTGLRERRDV